MCEKREFIIIIINSTLFSRFRDVFEDMVLFMLSILLDMTYDI